VQKNPFEVWIIGFALGQHFSKSPIENEVRALPLENSNIVLISVMHCTLLVGIVDMHMLNDK